MAVKEVTPAYSRLFFNQFEVSFWKSSWVEKRASKPAVKSRDKEIVKVMIGGVRIVDLAEFGKERLLPLLSRCKGTLNNVILVFWFDAMNAMLRSR
jgi:hypothetical protein